MQQGYPPQGQYPRGGYGGYGMGRGGYPPQNPMAYGQYPGPAYPQGYGYQQYPNPMYGAPHMYPDAGYPIGRDHGGGGFYPPMGPGGAPFRGGPGFRGGRGGFRGYRKKKPFVGGSLETQKEWERQTACCFFMQGKCKFGENCRFLHEETREHPCQFGDKCRVHGTGAADDSASQEGSQSAKSSTSAPSAEEKKEEVKRDNKQEGKTEKKTETTEEKKE